LKNNLLAIAILILGISGSTTAQDRGQHRWEIYGGYLNGQNVYSAKEDDVTLGGATQKVTLCTADGDANFGPNFEKLLCSRNTFHGFDAAASFAFHRYLAVSGDFTWQRHKATYVDDFGPAAGVQTSTNTETKYMVFGGVQVKDQRNSARWKPFAHALAGIAHERLSGVDVNPVEGNSNYSDQPTSLALKLGGGLDVRLSHRLDLRAIEFDYVPIFAGDRALTINPPTFGINIIGKTANNFTIGAGIVIH